MTEATTPFAEEIERTDIAIRSTVTAIKKAETALCDLREKEWKLHARNLGYFMVTHHGLGAEAAETGALEHLRELLAREAVSNGAGWSGGQTASNLCETVTRTVAITILAQLCSGASYVYLSEIRDGIAAAHKEKESI